ncbi:transmembrane epididymal protein 1A-like [Trichechus manatus latirostris]|uniref:Transmembrane epididymal protein 1A-like n=1 Tax=Trichechus manatus latirostris TaxID=127582 RepID=A0A2Y9DWK7_TRIMA|nr:transmembrane epididymal protein 1A-like [Trichechus manatus latirostris]
MVDWKDPRQPFQNHNSWQHATIFGFFLLSGLVDLISQVWLARQSIKLEQAGTVLALAVLLLQMVAHIEHKNALEIRTHSLLLLPIFLLVLVLTTEVWVPSQPSLWVFKIWLLLVFGSWMLQMTSMLYAPLSSQPWRADSPEDLAFLTIFFCWHLAIQAAVLTVVYALCSLWHRRCSSCIEVPSTRYQPCPTDPSSEELEKLRVEAVLQDGNI